MNDPKNAPEAAPADKSCWRWWYRGRMAIGPVFRFEGLVLAADFDTAAEAVEREMRKRYPHMRWMNGSLTESAGRSLTIGPTLQARKTVAVNPEWPHIGDGVFLRPSPQDIADRKVVAGATAPQPPAATMDTPRMPSDQSLAQEVIDRRMIGNMLVITLESYLHVFGLPGDELRTLIAKWRQIPGAR